MQQLKGIISKEDPTTYQKSSKVSRNHTRSSGNLIQFDKKALGTATGVCDRKACAEILLQPTRMVIEAYETLHKKSFPFLIFEQRPITTSGTFFH